MRKSAFWVLAPLGVFSAILVLSPTVLAIATWGERLSVLHPILEPVFYVSVFAGLYFLALRPVIIALSAPDLQLSALSKSPYNSKMICAKRILKNPKLSKEFRDELGLAVIRKGILDEPLRRAMLHLDESSQAIIDEKARVVFVSNIIVQNGRLEAVTLLMINLQLVQDLITHYGHRTSLKSLWGIYSEVFITAFLIDRMDEVDLDSALELILSNSITEIPGFSYVVHSLIAGTTSSLFTLRVGAITRELLCNGLRDASPRHERRVNANAQAFSRAAAILPAATAELSKTILQKAGSLVGRRIFGPATSEKPAGS